MTSKCLYTLWNVSCLSLPLHTHIPSDWVWFCDPNTEFTCSDVAATDLNLEESFSVHAGISHTRWATHGEPAPRNSHPQSSDARNEFLVVHNGVITNYEVHMILLLIDFFYNIFCSILMITLILCDMLEAVSVTCMILFIGFWPNEMLLFASWTIYRSDSTFCIMCLIFGLQFIHLLEFGCCW